jgi:hypothetical protein
MINFEHGLVMITHRPPLFLQRIDRSAGDKRIQRASLEETCEDTLEPTST